MNCPFYGCNVVQASTGHWYVFPGTTVSRGGLTEHISNRCGLITDAHSPCYMVVGEGMVPDWKNCVRNPVFASENVASACDKPQHDRWLAHQIYMQNLVQIRKTIAPKEQ